LHSSLGCIECMRCSLFLLMFATSCGSSRLHYAKMTKQIKSLLGLNTSGGPWNIVLDVAPDPPQRGGGLPNFKFWDPLLALEQLKLQTWNFLCVQRGEGRNKNCATVGHMRICVWITTHFHKSFTSDTVSLSATFCYATLQLYSWLWCDMCVSSVVVLCCSWWACVSCC